MYLQWFSLPGPSHLIFLCFFFFNDTATTEIYTLSLHDALPIFLIMRRTAVRAIAILVFAVLAGGGTPAAFAAADPVFSDRKSTRLNSSHSQISYAVFCLKKKIDNATIVWSGHRA